MRHAPSPLPPLQPLLFWETLILFFAAGIVAARFPLPALTACGLLAWTDSRTRRPLCCLAALLCIAAGWWTGVKAEPAVPETVPAWLEKALTSQRAVAVEGTDVRVRGLPDERLHVVLRGVRPDPDSEALPGDLALTWERPQGPRPLPSQTLSGRLKIRPVRGFRNSGLWNSEIYWHRQGVFFQAWTKEDKADIVVSGAPSPRAALRERLRQKVADAAAPFDAAAFLPGLAVEATGAPPALREDAEAFPAQPPRVSAPEGKGAPRHTAEEHEARLKQGEEGIRAGAVSPVIPALLFGDRFLLRTPDLQRVNAAGLMHSLALSGQHLAVAGLGALAASALIGLFFPRFFLRMPAYSLMALLSVPLAAVYLWLGGAPPSLIRAALMLGLVCLLRHAADLLPERLHGTRNLRPPFSFPDILIMALACMVLSDPLCLYDLGVQLSFSAVAGIALCSPLLRRLWRPFAPSPFEVLHGDLSPLRAAAKRFLELLWLTLGCSVAAQLATLPLVLDAFGRSTVWFPLNLLWLPILGFLVLPLAFLGLLACAAGWDQVAGCLLHLASLPCDALLSGLRWLEDHAGLDAFVAPRPHWTALLGFGAVGVAACLRLNRERLPLAGKRLLIAGALLLCVGPLLRVHAFFEPAVSLRALDVGQGQALLLEWPHGGRALIDGGGLFSERFDVGRDIVSPLLTANALPRLDFIAVSHPDRDHIKGLLFIASRFSLKAAYTARIAGLDPPSPPGAAAPALAEAFASVLALRGIPRHTLEAGDRISLAEGLALEVLSPPRGKAVSGNDGLVLRLVFQGRGLALLPGDAEKPALRELLRSGTDLSAEVLILPHHGSAGSLLPELYDAVRPSIAIASAGAYNAYRLPSRRIREELARRGIPLRVTGEEGEIRIRWNTRRERGRPPDKGAAALSHLQKDMSCD